MLFFSIKHRLCNYKLFQENKLDCRLGVMRVMGSGYNTDEASLTGLQLTFFCGGLVPNIPRTGTGPDPLYWYCGLLL